VTRRHFPLSQSTLRKSERIAAQRSRQRLRRRAVRQKIVYSWGTGKITEAVQLLTGRRPLP